MVPLARRVQRLPETDAAYRGSCRLFFGSLHGTCHPGLACATISAIGQKTPAMDFIHFKPEPA